MKKLVITESQLKRLTKSLVSEQQTNLGGLPVFLDLRGQTPEESQKKEVPASNPNFGTLTFKVGNKQVKIRLFTSRLGNVNIVELTPTTNGAKIVTLKGTEKELDKEIVNTLLKFVQNLQTKPNDTVQLDSSMMTGKLLAKKV
jgi:hypothetical protein